MAGNELPGANPKLPREAHPWALALLLLLLLLFL